ncbi:MAG TPA: ROK family protein [Acidimicrobiales bacterium]|nr:ROK family protein [Acidimicrobiales bacterium]
MSGSGAAAPDVPAGQVAEPPVTLGIDVGGTKMLGVALDAAGAVLAEFRRPSAHVADYAPSGTAGAEALLGAMAELSDELCSSLEAAGHPPAVSVGVGVPGLVDDTGRLRFAPNLPAGDDMEVAELLGRLLGLPVVADNDATCATVAEWVVGAAAGSHDALVVTFGTGIGGGLVCDDRIMRGANGFAGEVGHMVVDPSGPQCTCGKRGCWERFASGSGLARLAQLAAQTGRLSSAVHLVGDDPDAVRGEHVTAAAEGGDPESIALLADFGRWVALGLSNLALVLDPDIIVVGGGLTHALSMVLDTVQSDFQEMLEGADRRPVIPIVPAALGEEAGAVGAALVARTDDRYAAGAHRRHGAPGGAAG